MAMSGDPSRNFYYPPPSTANWESCRDVWPPLEPRSYADAVVDFPAWNGHPPIMSQDTSLSSPFPFPPPHSLSASTSPSASTSLSAAQPLSAHPYGLNGVYGNRFAPEPSRSNLFDVFAPQPQPQPQQPVRVVIRNLSANTTEDAVRLMLVFSTDLVSVELLASNHSADPRFRSAVVYFRSLNGALQAKANLNGRTYMNNSGEIQVDIPDASAYSSPVGMTPSSGPLASPSAASSIVDPFTSGSRPQPSIGNGFPSHDATSPTMRSRFFGSVSAHQDLAAPDTEAGNHYRNLFNPQSPIGNHLANEQSGRLGKYLINNELGDDDDSELLRDSIAYVENGTPAQRRATAPNIPTSQMESLSIHTRLIPSYIPTLTSPDHGVNGSNGYMRGGQQQQQQQQQSQQTRHSLNQMPQQRPQQSRSQAQQNQQDKSEKQQSPNPQQQDRQHQQSHQQSYLQAHQLAHQLAHQQAHQHSPQHSHHHPHHHSRQQAPHGKTTLPAVNPADQNPPCNTLYVGNLPPHTTEDQLRLVFSKQRGFKRLCFRTKPNGPMCFVEFDDISLATRALSEMYGTMLDNSAKTGIRLSFSKNPLGVRSSQPASQASQTNAPPMNGNGAAQSNASNGFAAANGPPPGLSLPPGLNSRGAGYTLTNQRNSHGNNNHQHQQQAQDSYPAYTTSNNGNGTGVNFSNGSSSRSSPFYANGVSRTARSPFA